MGGPTKDYVTVQELAERAGLTTARIRQLLAEGRELQGEKLFRVWVIRKAEAERWLRDRERAS
jgi:plasmid maintenance system antidote protein VapI